MYLDVQGMFTLRGSHVKRCLQACAKAAKSKKGPNFDVFGPGDPQDVNLKKNTCWKGTSLDQTASFEPTCVKLSLLVWSLQVSKKQKKAGHTCCVYFTYAWSDP